MNLNQEYKLFQNCLPVKGYLRSVIVDFHREETHYIPNLLFDFLIKNQVFSYEGMVLELGQVYTKEYFSFLFEKELIFKCNFDNHFPKIDYSYYFPFRLESAIIDLKENFEYSLSKAFKELETINCRNIQIRDFDGKSTQIIYENIGIFDKSSVVRIEILSKYNSENLDLLKKLMEKIRVISIIITSHPHGDERIKLLNDGIYYTDQSILSEHSCGHITHNCLNSHQRTIMKAINFNSCLYKKIGIDQDGYMKNCPAMKKNFGHISNTSISEAIQSEMYPKLGLINKDQINVCKDCEFRYNCSDCRAFVEGEYDFPKKCEYNPYICKWQGEEGYLSLEECGVVSSNNEFTIDHERIAKINAKLWAD